MVKMQKWILEQVVDWVSSFLNLDWYWQEILVNNIKGLMFFGVNFDLNFGVNFGLNLIYGFINMMKEFYCKMIVVVILKVYFIILLYLGISYVCLVCSQVGGNCSVVVYGDDVVDVIGVGDWQF